MNDDDFYKNIDQYIEEASNRTDKKLAMYISSRTIFKDEEILSLFPEEEDLKKLTEVINIVNSASKNNNEAKEFFKNLEGYADIAFKLIKSIII